jgi:hypothetical protein
MKGVSMPTVLTVLSALARLGIDPWQESARLAQLSAGTATQRLTIISGLPNGRWAPADAGAIAARLVKFLPVKRVSQLPSRGTAGLKFAASPRIMLFIGATVLVGSIFLAFASFQRHGSVPPVDAPYSSARPPPSTER